MKRIIFFISLNCCLMLVAAYRPEGRMQGIDRNESLYVDLDDSSEECMQEKKKSLSQKFLLSKYLWSEGPHHQISHPSPDARYVQPGASFYQHTRYFGSKNFSQNFSPDDDRHKGGHGCGCWPKSWYSFSKKSPRVVPVTVESQGNVDT